MTGLSEIHNVINEVHTELQFVEKKIVQSNETLKNQTQFLLSQENYPLECSKHTIKRINKTGDIVTDIALTLFSPLSLFVILPSVIYGKIMGDSKLVGNHSTKQLFKRSARR